MSAYVFLGPTLPIGEARALLDATYLPPVTMGDVAAVCTRDPAAIVIIDGLFERTPSVWHKEILHALSRGVRVYGGSSMGALRAAELDAFGMVGAGWIYERYRDGRIEGDDEVAVVHGPAELGYRCLCEPMVNLRYGLERAEALGLITPSTHEALLGAAKRRFYADRSWRALRDDGAALGVPPGELDALLELVRQERPDVKRADAIALLERVARDQAQGSPGPATRLELEATWFWTRMVEQEVAARVEALFGGGAPEAERGADAGTPGTAP